MPSSSHSKAPMGPQPGAGGHLQRWQGLPHSAALDVSLDPQPGSKPHGQQPGEPMGGVRAGSRLGTLSHLSDATASSLLRRRVCCWIVDAAAFFKSNLKWKLIFFF